MPESPSPPSAPRRGLLAEVFQRGYREVTPAALIVGLGIGLVMNVAITYSGLKIGFTLGGSAIAAVLGFGILRGILRTGTIVEVNLVQTVASAVNTSNSGVIFTVPVLFLIGVPFDPLWLGAACVAGAVLGVAFIIPTRKQMIEMDRLRFPSGTAVATVLRSPGEGVAKSRVLIAGIASAMAIYFFTQAGTLNDLLSGGSPFYAGYRFPTYASLGIAGLGAELFDVGRLLRSLGIGWPETMNLTWAIAPFALGAGFITGAPGLVVLAGGVLAYWILTPYAYSAGWTPAELGPEAVSAWVNKNVNRFLGIGMLMGGAAVGLALAVPALRSALRAMRASGARGAKRVELPLSTLVAAVVLAFVVLFAAALATVADGSVSQAVLIAAVGTAWIWFAGVVIAQCTGMTDWSPISGMSLLTVMLCLFLTGHQVGAAVLIGAAVCVAITLSADMMTDLKTGHLVGALPLRQQFGELVFVWIGPILCLAVVWMLAQANLEVEGVAFGGQRSPAPQAVALQATIEGVRGGDAPLHLYALGGVLGVLLSLSGIAGLGVLVGLSMYLPIVYLLPYGLGCVVQMVLKRTKGVDWCERWGVPFAAGLLVGEGLLGVVFAGLALAS
ncbi:MAG TPA: OPT/YSL family transporter [Planctomycetota bacterium]|nr:OPT/YSL family transporter [Planctomycetota bacterium]